MQGKTFVLWVRVCLHRFKNHGLIQELYCCNGSCSWNNPKATARQTLCRHRQKNIAKLWAMHSYKLCQNFHSIKRLDMRNRANDCNRALFNINQSGVEQKVHINHRYQRKRLSSFGSHETKGGRAVIGAARVHVPCTSWRVIPKNHWLYPAL